MKTIQGLIADLITKYYFFTAFILLISLMLYKYLKRWPKKIRISLLDENNNHIGVEHRKQFRYAINGNRSEKDMTINANPMSILKFINFGERVEVIVKHPRKVGEPISHSEIKIFDRMTYVDIKFNKGELEEIDAYYNELKNLHKNKGGSA